MITRKVHTFSHVNVGNFSGDCFQTYYTTEESRRFTIFVRMYINVRVEWLGTPIPFYDTDRVPWIENILVPELCWGDGGSYKTWALETQSRPCFVGRSVLWCGAVLFRPNYLPSSPVNTRTIVRRVRDVCLRENRLVRDQTISRALHTGGDERGNRSNDDLDGWVDQ